MKELTPKATRLVIRLLREYAEELEFEIEHGLSEDFIADASNDLGFVQALRQDLEK